MQNILVYIIVAIAAGVAIFKVIKTFRRQSKSDCEVCEDCPLKDDCLSKKHKNKPAIDDFSPKSLQRP
ncbi:MAG: FeoB-associated Cys-rich membrane protein [Candidatus Symbiothrix sp.]|nr:FeoB-associated Cys-rich membrane protein [Candidatus Symbiothrix sp.]